MKRIYILLGQRSPGEAPKEDRPGARAASWRVGARPCAATHGDRTRSRRHGLPSRNETDAERRREIVADTWTGDGTYVDPHAPHAAVEGREGIVEAAV